MSALSATFSVTVFCHTDVVTNVRGAVALVAVVVVRSAVRVVWVMVVRNMFRKFVSVEGDDRRPASLL